MKHTYKIKGMSCNGCKTHVEKALGKVEGVINIAVDLQKAEAVIEMTSHVPLEKLQLALKNSGGNYSISVPNIGVHVHNHDEHQMETAETSKSTGKSTGMFYCPMHCEGDKTYEKHGICPVCGMDLVEQLSIQKPIQYTCPMHPEILRAEPGACPICGMELIPLKPVSDGDEKTYSGLLYKLKIAITFTLPIFIISMMEMIPGSPLVRMLSLKYWNWVQLVLSIPVVFYATRMFFERAYRSIISWKLNMFTLIGIGSGVSWLFSIVALLFPNLFPVQFKTEQGTVYVYFEAATVILTLVLLGQVLEARAHSRTSSAIKELLKLAPNNATKVIDGKEQVVSIDTIQKGEVLRVKPGEKIPVDGTIQDGETTIDESMISGEPIPVDKKAGDTVSSGTINGNKSFLMIAEKVGSETLLAKIIEMVNTASRSKAAIQKLADKISGYFVPIVVGASILTFFVWAKYGPEPSYVFAFVNAIAVLIIACPCALGLATPMSVMVGVGKGAQSGVLIKNAESLEGMNSIDVVIIDKTGTLTEGKPSVAKVVSTNSDFTKEDILQKIVSLNSNSEHPLAQATLRYGEENKIEIKHVTNFEAVIGKGVTAMFKGELLALGNEKLMQQVKAEIAPEIFTQVKTVQKSGKTVSYLSQGNAVIGFIVISDKIKASSAEAILKLQKEGLKVIMLTGDNEDTAKAVSETLHLDGYKSQMMPEDKLKEIKRLQSEGKKVAMAGDGINDAPALSQADIGIAMGTGTDVAIESASITLVKGDLNGIAKARSLSNKVMRNIKQNLFFALCYNILGIPIAAGVLYPFFGLLLSPMIAALAMSFSSVSVIGNAIRLRNINL